jgi:hypothetical protein
LTQPLERVALPAEVVRIDEVAVARVAAGRAIVHGVGIGQEVGSFGILLEPCQKRGSDPGTAATHGAAC